MGLLARLLPPRSMTRIEGLIARVLTPFTPQSANED